MLPRLRKDPSEADLALLLALARERGYEPRFLDAARGRQATKSEALR